jgi:hypothetical protein
MKPVNLPDWSGVRLHRKFSPVIKALVGSNQLIWIHLIHLGCWRKDTNRRETKYLMCFFRPIVTPEFLIQYFKWSPVVMYITLITMIVVLFLYIRTCVYFYIPRYKHFYVYMHHMHTSRYKILLHMRTVILITIMINSNDYHYVTIIIQMTIIQMRNL